jgi:hypothetical protein
MAFRPKWSSGENLQLSRLDRETSNCSLSVDVNDGSDDDIQTDDNSIIPESGKLDTSNRNSLCSFCIIDA